jgi:hypothetical protein
LADTVEFLLVKSSDLVGTVGIRETDGVRDPVRINLGEAAEEFHGILGDTALGYVFVGVGDLFCDRNTL